MAYIVMAYIVMADMVMADMVMAYWRYECCGLCAVWAASAAGLTTAGSWGQRSGIVDFFLFFFSMCCHHASTPAIADGMLNNLYVGVADGMSIERVYACRYANELPQRELSNGVEDTPRRMSVRPSVRMSVHALSHPGLMR